MATIRAQLGDYALADQIHSLWQEYEDGQTPEARMVKDLDKTEMLLQAYSYETQQFGLDLQVRTARTLDTGAPVSLKLWSACLLFPGVL